MMSFLLFSFLIFKEEEIYFVSVKSKKYTDV